MMNLYAAEQHLLILSDSIDAESHRHSFVQVAISLQGSFGIEVDGNRIDCAGIVIDSNIVHRLHAVGHPLLMLLIDRTSHLAAAFREGTGKEGYRLIDTDRAREAAGFVRSAQQNIQKTGAYAVFLEGLLERLGFNRLLPTLTDLRVKELIGLIQACTDSEHSIDHYARQLNLSSSRLSHLFKGNVGISLSGYLLLHKLQKASYLIFQGVSITDAALAAGFDTPSHFANTSRKLLGMTARDIRKDSVFLQVSYLYKP